MEYERKKSEVAVLLYQEGFRPYVACDEVAKRILSLVEIKSDDQSLPENPHSILTDGKWGTYGEGQQDMVKVGFIRVAPKRK